MQVHAIQTGRLRRVHAFVEESPIVIVLSHDRESPARLEAKEPLKLSQA